MADKKKNKPEPKAHYSYKYSDEKSEDDPMKFYVRESMSHYGAPVATPKKRVGEWTSMPAERRAYDHTTTLLANLGCHSQKLTVSPIETVRAAIEEGFERTAFEELKNAVQVSSEALGRTIRVPMRTLARRERFQPDESERIFRVASAFQRALDVLGGLDAARRWFSAPQKALANKTPMEYCDTEPGAREVEHLLGRLEHGVFS